MAAKSEGIDPREYRPENGESWLDMNKRIKSFLEETVDQYVLKKKFTESDSDKCSNVRDLSNGTVGDDGVR